MNAAPGLEWRTAAIFASMATGGAASRRSGPSSCMGAGAAIRRDLDLKRGGAHTIRKATIQPARPLQTGCPLRAHQLRLES